MNYIKCPNCGKEISNKSNSCIYCGISRSIIDQRIKEKEISKIKETSSKVEGFFNNHKIHIVIGELMIIILIIVIYAYSYLPKILTYSKNERIINNIKKCEEYGGKWNEDTNLCETEYGTIEIK